MQAEDVTSDLRRDWQVRVAAIEWILERCERTGSAVQNYTDLVRGFSYRGRLVKLKHPQQGIYRPAECVYPISITTSFSDPYGDAFSEADRELRYRFKGRPRSEAAGGQDLRGQLVNIDNASNRGLRELMHLGWPLVHFKGVATGEYLAVAPVVLFDEDPVTQTFGVAMGADSSVYAGLADEVVLSGTALPDPWTLDQAVYRGGAALRVSRGVFRHRVLDAYGRRCAACSVAAAPLLEAVRIVGCGKAGSSRVLPSAGSYDLSNGLSLCKLHHAAYERRYVGITPDYRVELREDAAAVAGLEGVCTQPRLHLPKRYQDQPAPHLLEARYEEFRAAAT